ncbi:hypothetical protein K9N50_09275 [bacterium]|nr:hypothetical protein [bacterium]
MRKTTTLFLTLLFMLSLAGTVSAADDGFQETLKKLVGENAEGYIAPFSTAFGTAMNSGLYHTAKPHALLGFDISLKLMYVTVPTEGQTFDFFREGAFPVPVDPMLGVTGNQIEINLENIYASQELPTVFGSDETVTIAPDTVAAKTEIITKLKEGGVTDGEIALIPQSEWHQMFAAMPAFPIKGIGYSVLPLAMPQVSIGLLKGTEVMLRFFPETEVDPEIGTIGLLGIGVKHSISQWIPIPMFPLDISGQFVWQKLTIGDMLESKHTCFNIEASKKLGIGISITPYVGLGMESSTMDVSYTHAGVDKIEGTADDIPISFSLDGDNGFRMTGGVRLGLLIGTLNVDYSLGEYSVISAGFGLTLR